MSFADFFRNFLQKFAAKKLVSKVLAKKLVTIFNQKRGVDIAPIDIERCNVWILQNFFLQTFMKRQKNGFLIQKSWVKWVVLTG